MRKEFEMMLIILVCAALGLITANIINLLYTQGIIFDRIVANTGVKIEDLMFFVFFAWVVAGIIIGVFRK